MKIAVVAANGRVARKVITEACDHNYEQKLVNEYNAAQLGLYGSKTGEEAKKHLPRSELLLCKRRGCNHCRKTKSRVV